MKKLLSILFILFMSFSCSKASSEVASNVNSSTKITVAADPFAGFNVSTDETKTTAFSFSVSEKTMITNLNSDYIYNLKIINTDTGEIICTYFSKDSLFILEKGNYTIEFTYELAKAVSIQLGKILFTEENLLLSQENLIESGKSKILNFSIVEDGFYTLSKELCKYNEFSIKRTDGIKLYGYNELKISNNQGSIVYLKKGDYTLSCNSLLVGVSTGVAFYGLTHLSDITLELSKVTEVSSGNVLLGSTINIEANDELKIGYTTLNLSSTSTVVFDFGYPSTPYPAWEFNGVLIQNTNTNEILDFSNFTTVSNSARKYSIRLPAGNYKIYESCPTNTPTFRVYSD